MGTPKSGSDIRDENLVEVLKCSTYVVGHCTKTLDELIRKIVPDRFYDSTLDVSTIDQRDTV
jgi:hypothetical protein